MMNEADGIVENRRKELVYCLRGHYACERQRMESSTADIKDITFCTKWASEWLQTNTRSLDSGGEAITWACLRDQGSDFFQHLQGPKELRGARPLSVPEY